jgi:hypothetical protein
MVSDRHVPFEVPCKACASCLGLCRGNPMLTSAASKLMDADFTQVTGPSRGTPKMPKTARHASASLSSRSVGSATQCTSANTQTLLVKGSNDFYGMNHYCANYIRHKDTEPELDDHLGNLDVLYQNKKGEWIGPETQSFWLRPMPLGFRKLIKWLSDRYGGPTFYVTENGTSLKGENDLPLEQLLDDEFRCEYFRGYVGALADAHTIDGVDVRGYSAWSLMEYVKNIPFPIPNTHLVDVLTTDFGWMPVRLLSVSDLHRVYAVMCSSCKTTPWFIFSLKHTFGWSSPLTHYLQQLRVGRGLHNTLRCHVRRLQGRSEAIPEKERIRDFENL